MAAVYRFRVSFEDHTDIYRDIEILSSQSFYDLHEAIQQAIGFDASKNATFYISNDYWRREKEVPLQITLESSDKKGKVNLKKPISAITSMIHIKNLFIISITIKLKMLCGLLRLNL